MKSKFTLLLMLFALVQISFASQNRKVLIIGIDGCRSDALQQANTPNLDALIATGLYTYDAWHLGITVSGPSWSTIMTGVWWNKHGVTSNTYTGSHFNEHPYFTTLAKQYKPNLKCVQVVEWAPMSDNVYNDSWDNKLKTPDGDGAATAAVAATQLADADLDCMFVYFDAVDLAGHSSGFDPANPSYMQAIENVDDKVGIVINALHNRPNYANEDWLVLITTDHGGRGTGHGGISFEERHIWWIGSGNNVTHQQVTAADPGTYNFFGTSIFDGTGVDQTLLKQSPVQADIAVTALHHLVYDAGIHPDTEPFWDLDGKSWLNVLTGVDNVTKEKVVTVYPNPTTGLTTLWFENDTKEAAKAEVYDMAGNIVQQTTEVVNTNKLNVDLQCQPAGEYIVRINLGTQTLTKKVTVAK